MQKIIFEENESNLSIKSGTRKHLELEWGLEKKKLTCKRGFTYFFLKYM